MSLITQRIASPHSSSRRGHQVRACVIHYSAAGHAKSTASWFADKASRVSCHFVVGRRADIYQCVELRECAWHCEPAEIVIDGEAYSDVNEMSIGIELANHGILTMSEGSWHYTVGGHLWPYVGPEPVEATLGYDNGALVHGHWEPYPDQQIDALQALLRKLAETSPEAVRNVIGHEEVAMPFGRKCDPGPLFPWGRLSRALPRRTRAVSGLDAR